MSDNKKINIDSDTFSDVWDLTDKRSSINSEKKDETCIVEKEKCNDINDAFDKITSSCYTEYKQIEVKKQDEKKGAVVEKTESLVRDISSRESFVRDTSSYEPQNKKKVKNKQKKTINKVSYDDEYDDYNDEYDKYYDDK